MMTASQILRGVPGDLSINLKQGSGRLQKKEVSPCTIADSIPLKLLLPCDTVGPCSLLPYATLYLLPTSRGGHVAAVELSLQAPEGVDVLIRDGVRESTPFLLACAMPGDSVGVVRRLLERDAAQLHDAVGDAKVSRRLLEGVAAAPWKRLREALVHRVDEASVRTPFSPGDFEVDDEDDEADRWKSRGVSVGKHNALHLAAAQNNAKVVDFLLQLPGIDIDANAREGDYGMTPLHCAVRTGALEALKVLLACKQVDVNALVESSGRIPIARKVPLSEAGAAKERDFVEGKCGRFWDGDTALHLAIRFGPSQIALQSVCELCRLTHLRPSIRNGPSGGRVTAVEVALQRWNREVVSDTVLEDKDKDATVAVINTVAEHRDMEMFVNRREADKKAMQDTLNALLVAATLIAGATFQGTLQPPAGHGSTSPVEDFWAFNVSSFYLSMCSIITTLEAFFPPGPAASLPHLEGVTSKLRVQMAVSTLSTGLAVLMGAAAFSEASYISSSVDTHVLLRNLRLVFVGTLCVWFLAMYAKASPTIFGREALLQLKRGLLGVLGLSGRGVYRSREELRVRNHSIKGSVSLLFVGVSCGVLGRIRLVRHSAPSPSPA